LTILDCACGLNPVEGASEVVHVDLFRTYMGKKNCADVIADAHFLPFRDNAFFSVFSSHTLEHCENPMQVLREFRRVGRVLVIKVPNGMFNKGGLNEDDGHIFSWTSKTFYQLLRKIYATVRLRGRVHWGVRGYARVHGLGLKQLAILKTLLFVLVLGEQNELEAVCF
jgi:SAM-dependent methyltransferase